MERSLLDILKNASQRLGGHIKEGNFIRIISHLDADGLTAAGVLGTALMRQDVPFRISIERGITPRLIDELKSEDAPIVFTDLGSGYLDLIKEDISDRDVIILDHHRPLDVPIPDNFVHVNPRLFGFDVGYEISGAGLAYLFARTLTEENDDLAWLAVVGALGDLQDRGRKLHSINKVIAERAVRGNLLEITTDLLFYGRETRPLVKSLASTTNPFLPGLSGKEDQCTALIQDSGIALKMDGRWRTLADLSQEEKKKLVLSITRFLAPKRTDVLKLIGEVYTLTREESMTPFRDAREFSSMLNACGRMKKSGLAISMCMGSRVDALREAEDVIAGYRKKLAKCMDWAMDGNVKELKNLYVIEGCGVMEEDVIGTITSIVASIFSDKVVVGFTDAEEEMGLVKVSARISERLSKAEVNVGNVIIDAAKSIGGRGGGHEAAAGAYVPKYRVNEFVDKCDQSLGT